MQEKTAILINKLKERYRDDLEACEVIKKAIKDIEYVERKEAAGNYTGQPSYSRAKELEAHLKVWF